MDCSIATRVRHALVIALSLLPLAPGMAYGNATPDPVVAMIAAVSPTVVRVVTERPTIKKEDKSAAGAANSATADPTTTTFGAGYIIDPSGYVGTNKHVVEGAISVVVVTRAGVRYPARIVGMPGQADLALLKIDAGCDALPFVRFGDSDRMQVGDPVIAIGSPFGFDNTVTAGIISAVNRDIMESPFDNYLQTDAAINHGNSGGPLFNMAGEVIGMNSVIYAPTPGFAGLAFAVPSNDLRFVFGRLMKTGEVKAGMLPIHTQAVTWKLGQAFGTPDLNGALVTSGPDDAGGTLLDKIRAGDVIRTFNGVNISDPRDLARKVARVPVGSDAVLGIFRDGGDATVHVGIRAYPETKPVVLGSDGPTALGMNLASARGKYGQPIVMVAAVDPAGAAAKGGLKQGDVIVEVQRTSVSDPDQALRILRAQSGLKHAFAAVLVEHAQTLSWLSIAVPRRHDVQSGNPPSVTAPDGMSQACP